MEQIIIKQKDALRKYEIHDCKASSRKFGNCEICGEFVDAVYYQTAFKFYLHFLPMKFYKVGELKEHYPKTGWSEMVSKFGHKKCLESSRNIF